MRRHALTFAGPSAAPTPYVPPAYGFACRLITPGFFKGGYLDERHYTNSDLAFALLHVGGFAKTVDGWREQRAYVNHAVDALAAADVSDVGAKRLLAMTDQELGLLRPTEPTPDGLAAEWVEVRRGCRRCLVCLLSDLRHVL